jgi:hypothetical protein
MVEKVKGRRDWIGERRSGGGVIGSRWRIRARTVVRMPIRDLGGFKSVHTSSVGVLEETETNKLR